MEKTELIKQQELSNRLMYFLKGDCNAVKMCMDLTYIAHLWDDLVDKDRTRSDTDINDAFRLALVEIPMNPFYRKFSFDLSPLFLNTILQWEDANVLESAEEHDKDMAYMLRASFLQIFNYCAFLIGGPLWAREIGPDMRRLYAEPLNSFKEEMNNA